MPIPPEVNQIPVHAKYMQIDGDPVSGTVEFQSSDTFILSSAGGIMLTSDKFVATLDANGEFTIDLPANNDPDVRNPTSYRVKEIFDQGGGSEYNISIPYDAVGTVEVASRRNTGIPTSQSIVGPQGAKGAPGADGIRGAWGPQDQGLHAWTFDPIVCDSTPSLVSGRAYAMAIPISTKILATKIWMSFNAKGSGHVASQNKVGIYASSGGSGNPTGGALAEVDITSWLGTGSPASEFDIPDVNLDPGRYWIAILINATTMPSVLGRAALLGHTHYGVLPLNFSRYRHTNTGLVSLPDGSAFASQTGTDFVGFWAGLA